MVWGGWSSVVSADLSTDTLRASRGSITAAAEALATAASLSLSLSLPLSLSASLSLSLSLHFHTVPPASSSSEAALASLSRRSQRCWSSCWMDPARSLASYPRVHSVCVFTDGCFSSGWTAGSVFNRCKQGPGRRFHRSHQNAGSHQTRMTFDPGLNARD